MFDKFKLVMHGRHNQFKFVKPATYQLIFIFISFLFRFEFDVMIGLTPHIKCFQEFKL